MRLILSGILLMLAGLILLFGMVVGWFVPGYLLALSAFAATFAGMVLGLLGIARKARLPR